MPKLPCIGEGEWLVMTKLWEKFPLTAAEVVERVQAEKKIGDASVRTQLKRLVAKKAVGYTVDENNSKIFYYHPLIQKEDCIRKENRNFLEKYYENSLGNCIAAFVDDAQLSDQEIERLIGLLNEIKGRER